MSVRLKLALVLSLAMVGATAAASAFFLHLQGRALVRQQAERRGLIVSVGEAAAREAVASGDIFPLIDAVRGLVAQHRNLVSAEVRMGEAPWQVVGERRPAERTSEMTASVSGGRDGKNAEVRLVFDEGLSAQERQAAYRVLLRDVMRSGAAAAAFGALAALLLAGPMTRRIVAIEKAVAGLGEGEFDVKVPAGGGDELGRLAAGVGRAAKSLAELEDAKRTFVASVTHELRAPLAAMRHHLKDLRTAGGLPEGAATRLDSFERNLGRLENFVTNVLETAKVTRGTLDVRPRPSQLGPILEDAADFFASHARQAGLELSAAVPPGLPPIRLDPDLMAQVVANLLSNAVKYTPRGGHVRVTAGRTADGAGLEFAVVDDGPGIPEEAQKRLFRPFERVKGVKGPGAGLGLALAKKVVELHGGALTLESAPGKGCAFRVRLPLEAAKPPGKAINAS